MGVFQDQEPAFIASLVRWGVIDAIQLHGHEDAAYIKTLREHAHAPIIQAFQIKTAPDLLKAQDSPADMILLDAGAGNGEPFDWTLLFPIKRPYFLAGGLTPENVAAAIQTLHPHGVDVSSGIETQGHKDHARMQSFISAVRSTE